MRLRGLRRPASASCRGRCARPGRWRRWAARASAARSGWPPARTGAAGPFFWCANARSDGAARLAGRRDGTGARLRLARSLGAALARMHAAGFTHPDLYSKHVLVGPDGEIACNSWTGSARSGAWRWRRGGAPATWRRCTPRWLTTWPGPASDWPVSAPTPARVGPRRSLLRAEDPSGSRGGCWRRRHVREKRQPPLGGGVQEWTTLEGGALCVTPALAAAWPGRPPEWLALDRQPAAPGQTLMRRWLTTADGQPALLVRRRRRLGPADLWRWLRGRPGAEPEQRQAALLLRLHRHAIDAPRVLAMGRRAALGSVESFVLTQPPAGAVLLTAWLARRPAPASRRRILARPGPSCVGSTTPPASSAGTTPTDGLAVRPTPNGRPAVVLADAERVARSRRPNAGQARDAADRRRVGLAVAGCDPADRRRFLAGYREPVPGDATGASPTHRWPGYRTADAPPPQGDPAMSASSVAAAGPPGGRGPRPRRLALGAAVARRPPAAPAARLAALRRAGLAGSHHGCGRHGSLPRQAGPLHRPPGPPGRRPGAAAPGRLSEAPFHGCRGGTACWRRCGRAAAGRPPSRSGSIWNGRGASACRCRATVAAAEYVGPAGRLRSFLAVEELHDMLPLSEAVPAGRVAPGAGGVPPLEARPDRRNGPPHAPAPRPPPLPQGPLPLPLLHPPRRHGRRPTRSWRGRVSLIDLHRLGRHPGRGCGGG